MHKVDTYAGIDVFLNGVAFEAELAGEKVSFQSFRQLADRIDEFKAKEAKSRKLNLPVVWRSGESFAHGIITGINLHSSQVLGLGQRPESAVVPDLPWIREVLTEIGEHAVRITALRDELQPFVLSTSRGSGNVRVSDYSAALDAIEAEFAVKTEAAIEAGVERESDGS